MFPYGVGGAAASPPGGAPSAPWDTVPPEPPPPVPPPLPGAPPGSPSPTGSREALQAPASVAKQEIATTRQRIYSAYLYAQYPVNGIQSARSIQDPTASCTRRTRSVSRPADP